MSRIVAFAFITAAPDFACDPAMHNAMKDAARAQEKQAESLRQLERIERDRLRMQDRAQRSAR